MKALRLILVLFTVALIFNVRAFKDVEASSSTITWTLDTSDTEHAIWGWIDFGTGIREILLEFPYDENIEFDNGTDTFNIKFYDLSTGYLETLDGELVYGEYLRGTDQFFLSFDVFDVSPLATQMRWTIATGYTDSNPAPAGWLDDLNANSTVTMTSGTIDEGFFRWEWVEGPDETGHVNYIYSNDIYVPLGTEVIGFRYNHSISTRLFDKEAEIYFYDDGDVLLDTLALYQYVSLETDDENPYGSIDIELYEVTDYEDIEYFSVKLLNMTWSPSALYSKTTGFLYIFDGYVNTVNFYSESVIVYSHKTLIGAIARFPQTNPTKTGEVFSHWITANGKEYNFTEITTDMLAGDTANFYAIFEDVPDALDTTVTDPTADEESIFTLAFTSLGFNDPISRTIIFGIFVVVTAGLLLWRGVSVISTIFVVGIELFFFMYLGLIPMFVSIIMILLLVFLGITQRGGGEAHE